MQKIKISNIIYIIFILSLMTFAYSCEKKEPAVQPEPGEIMKKISEKFPDNPELKKESITYDTREKSKEMSEKTATALYSDDKNKPVDLSKIEKYSIIKADTNSAAEIGIFKLYDKTNAGYIKEMVQTRIAKMQNSDSESKNTDMTDIIEIFNNAEIRSYGNYVYYVSHPQKDKVFEIIEDTLRGV